MLTGPADEPEESPLPIKTLPDSAVFERPDLIWTIPD